MPALNILLVLVTEFLSLLAFFWSCKVTGIVFCFSEGGAYGSSLWSFPGHRFSLPLCVLTDLLQKLTLPLSGALSWASYEVGIWKAGHAEHCGQSILRSLWSGFLVESLTCSVGSTSVLLCTSHSPPPRGAAPTWELWMGRQRAGSGSASQGWEARGSLTCPHLTQQRSRWLRRALLAPSCAALEGCVKWVKSDCSYPFQCILSHISFAPVVGWNFSMVLLDFHRGSLISGWLSKLVFSRGSWTAAARNWSWFTGQCMVDPWDWCLYMYYLITNG